MRLHHILIGIAVMIVFSMLSMQIATKIGNNYNISYDSDFEKIQTNLSNSKNAFYNFVGEDLATNSPGGEDAGTIEGADTYEDGIVKSGWKTLTQIPNMFNIFKGLVTIISEKLFINPAFYKLAFVALIIIVSLIGVSAILRNQL